MVLDFSWMADFFTPLVHLAIYLLEFLFYEVGNVLIVALAGACSMALTLLPSGSFNAAPSVNTSILPVVNWFIPVSGVVNSLALYFTGFLLYLGAAPFLRWFKVVK